MTDQTALAALLDGIRDEVREAVLEGDAQDCSSADCIADAVYEIVRVRLHDAGVRATGDAGLLPITTELAHDLRVAGWTEDVIGRLRLVVPRAALTPEADPWGDEACIGDPEHQYHSHDSDIPEGEA